MKIKVAKTAGFCMGVRRAVNLALDVSEKRDGPVYTCGPLIHNPQVLGLFSKKGIAILKDIPEEGFGTVIIRAHGVSPYVVAKLRSSGFDIIDATCPRVAKVQTIIKANADKGYATVIVGDRNHPEVSGLIGYSGPEVHVVCDMSELETLPVFEKAILVAQTTQNVRFYGKVKDWIVNNFPQYDIFDTICDSTERRQIEVKLLAARVDVLIVVGGRQSGNTKRLSEVAEASGTPALHVENEFDLFACGELYAAKIVGITAGASTPTWIIERVCSTVKQIGARNSRLVRRV